MHPNMFHWSSKTEHIRDDTATLIFAVGSKYTWPNYLIIRQYWRWEISIPRWSFSWSMRQIFVVSYWQSRILS